MLGSSSLMAFTTTAKPEAAKTSSVPCQSTGWDDRRMTAERVGSRYVVTATSRAPDRVG